MWQRRHFVGVTEMVGGRELVREGYRLARSITDGKKQAALVVSGVLSGLERAG